MLVCDIQNVRLSTNCREIRWTKTEPKFGSDEGKIMLAVRTLYRLRSSDTEFRTLLVELLGRLNYIPLRLNPDGFMCPALTSNRF